jgi:hypothetical protein
MILKKFLYLFSAIFLCSSCNLIYNTPKDEQLITCNSNCYSLNLHGTVTDKFANSGIKTIPVTLNWKKPTCLFCTDNMIDKVVSDNSGRFEFANSVDTSYFSTGYQLYVSIPLSNDYIVFPWENYFVINSVADSKVEQLKFELYPRTQLTIRIVKQQADSYFDTFVVEHAFKKDFQYVDRVISRVNNQYDNPVNDTYLVETAAGMKTYIKWTKTVGSVNTENVDSIICVKNKDNFYTIKY